MSWIGLSQAFSAGETEPIFEATEDWVLLTVVALLPGTSITNSDAAGITTLAPDGSRGAGVMALPVGVPLTLLIEPGTHVIGGGGGAVTYAVQPLPWLRKLVRLIDRLSLSEKLDGKF
jgi:hypothetical protein